MALWIYINFFKFKNYSDLKILKIGINTSGWLQNVEIKKMEYGK